MAERRVRTVEGARLFGRPIGTVIEDRSPAGAVKQKRATSLTRLKSLQRQFAAAKDVGDLGRMKKLQAAFTAAFSDYTQDGSQLTDVLDSLTAQRGRNDMAIGKKKELDD